MKTFFLTIGGCPSQFNIGLLSNNRLSMTLVLNTLDLKAGTHFTVDPDIGLWISVAFVPFMLVVYFVVLLIGSRRDKGIVAFLEQTLAARRIG